LVYWVPGPVSFLGFKSLIRLFFEDAFLGRPMLPRSQPDYAGMPMMCSTGKTIAIGGIMDGCNIAIVVGGIVIRLLDLLSYDKEKNSHRPPLQNTYVGIHRYHTSDI
jgi:hypothetical protein